MRKLIIAYDPLNGYVCPDARVAVMMTEFLDEYHEANKTDPDDMACHEIIVGNSVPIEYIRVAVKEGCIDPKNILFKFIDSKEKETKYIQIDRNGKLINAPKGFCDYSFNLMAQLF